MSRSSPRKRGPSKTTTQFLDSRLRGNERETAIAALLHAGSHVLVAQIPRHAVKPGLKRAARGAVLERLRTVRQVRNDLRSAGNPGRTLLLLQGRHSERAAALRRNELGARQWRRQHRARRTARGIKAAPMQLATNFSRPRRLGRCGWLAATVAGAVSSAPVPRCAPAR
jgi:hypothetical protein